MVFILAVLSNSAPSKFGWTCRVPVLSGLSSRQGRSSLSQPPDLVSADL